jgi:hypothetical protein
MHGGKLPQEAVPSYTEALRSEAFAFELAQQTDNGGRGTPSDRPLTLSNGRRLLDAHLAPLT